MADTGLKSPTVSDNAVWTNPNNAFASDNVYAEANTASDRQRYTTFGFIIASGAAIDGIEVLVECKGFTGGESLQISLSWNAGTTWTAAKSGVAPVPSSEGTITFGGSSDTWGRTWSDTEFSNANFKLRGITPNGGQFIYVDHIQAKVYYTEVGGSTTWTGYIGAGFF